MDSTTLLPFLEQVDAAGNQAGDKKKGQGGMEGIAHLELEEKYAVIEAKEHKPAANANSNGFHRSGRIALPGFFPDNPSANYPQGNQADKDGQPQRQGLQGLIGRPSLLRPALGFLKTFHDGPRLWSKVLAVQLFRCLCRSRSAGKHYHQQ